MVNASEVGHSPEENEVPKDLASQVRDFNQKITELIRKVESQEGVTNKEMAEIDREYDALDASLSDQSFDSDETGKLYDNFQKRIPSRIARLKEKLGQLNSPVSTIAAVQGSETNLGAVNTDTSREANESTSPETIDVWPPDFVTEIRNILYRRRDQFKAEFYPNGDYILDSNFDFTDPDSVQVLHNLEAVLDQLKTVDPDTGKSELSIIETKKKTVEKTLKFLENSSKVSDVLKHEELEALIKEIDDFLTGYRTLEIDLYQELAPIIHPEIRSLIETDLSPDLSGATTPAQKFEVYKNFAFNTYEPEVEKNIGAITPIIKQLENDNKEGHSQAITDKYVKPAKDEVENWKTVAFDYWEENLADLYPTIFNDALPDSYSQVISSYGDSRLFAMDIEDLFNAKARIEETLRIAKVLLDSEVSAGRVPSSQMDVRYQNLINEQYQRAQSILDKITKITKEQTDPSMATRTIAKFLEGGFAPDAKPEWKDGRWRTEHPAKLAKAIWSYIEQVLLKGEARADLSYMSVDILGTHLDLPDSPTIVSLLRAFISLNKEFKGKTINGKDKGDLFFEIGDKMITDIVQIQRIYSFGNEVHKREQDAHALVAYFTESGNQMTYVDHERTYQMGVGYMDYEGGVALSERILWAQQAYFAMHDPIYYKNAVVGSEGYQTAGAKDKKDIIYGIDAKNDLTYFPEAVGNENERLLKRFVIRQIAGSETPPSWVSFPKIPGETLHDWSVRKLEAIRADLKARYTELKSKFEANSTTNQANRKDEYILPVINAKGEKENKQLEEINRGYIAEQLTHNLGEYSLEPCKAEGQVLLNDGAKRRVETSKGSFELPVLNPHKGPTAIFYVSRFWSIGDYRAKLTQEQGGGEGSTGPRETMRDFNSIMDTQYDYYFFIPNKGWKDPDAQITGSETPDELNKKKAKQKEREPQGVTLKEAIILSENLTDTKNIPFSTALSSPYRGGTEQMLGWYEQIRLSENHWKRIIQPDGLGVNWAQLRRFEPGSGGAMVTFDPSTVTAKLYPFAREITYMMQRDKGVKMYDWKNVDYWRRHISLEELYVKQLEAGVSEPVKPTEHKGKPVTDDEWKAVREYRIAPTYRYRLVDMYDPTDQTNTKVVRYAHQWHEVVKAPNSKENRDEFEDAVLSNPENTVWDQYKKLLIGKIIIGSISVGDVDNIGFKEIQAISQVLSKEAWEKIMNSFSRKILDFSSGRQRHPAYQGLGFFTMPEVSAMLRRAGVNTRWGAVITDLMETVAKVK